MLCKYGKQTRDSVGAFYLRFSLIFYILGAFLIKQLFHSRLLDMRLVIANSALRASPVGLIFLPSHIQRALME